MISYTLIAIVMEEQGHWSAHGHMTAITVGVRRLQQEIFFRALNEKD